MNAISELFGLAGDLEKIQFGIAWSVIAIVEFVYIVYLKLKMRWRKK
jgi:hypothetical protein